jgi:hypothetical protein
MAYNIFLTTTSLLEPDMSTHYPKPPPLQAAKGKFCANEIGGTTNQSRESILTWRTVP